MTTYTETRVVKAPRGKLFDLIADVERYPDFLPMWVDARVERRDEGVYHTEQEVGLGPIRERFRTKMELSRPTRIEVTSTDGLFRDFGIMWDFGESGGGCRVTISMTWQVHSPLLQKAIDMLLPETARSMVTAFEERAREVADR